ncbi:hypothetical protein [Variovorax rhizosphaerae]|uniref:DUF2726 domain-containing protein n=1 Tax=Variovorax rhizosphaerae TaxID=1836200 RepID=A0ABU8X0Y6_9BURK
MNNLLQIQPLIVGMAVVLIVLALAYFALRRKDVKVQSKRLIDSARMRSGYVPLEVPTSLGLPERYIQDEGQQVTVDEMPRLRIRYLGVNCKKVQQDLQVEYLDLKKKLLTCHIGVAGDVQRIFLHQVLAVGNAETGKQFDLDTWVETVRVARRRRSLQQ